MSNSSFVYNLLHSNILIWILLHDIFVMEQALAHKYAVVVATGENYGKRDVMKILRNLILYSGGRNYGSIGLNIKFNEEME